MRAMCKRRSLQYTSDTITIVYQDQQQELFNRLEQGSATASIVEIVDDYTDDVRMCFTSVVFLSDEIRSLIISRLIEPLREADTRQYFYMPESLHITIQNIRQVNNPPQFTKEDIVAVQNIFREVLSRHERFSFDLQGLFMMPTSLSVRAFSDERLKKLVIDLRRSLERAGVSDDKQYASDDVVFGNCTFCRYTEKPNNVFTSMIRDLKQVRIGTQEVDRVSLITTNTACRPEKTKIIEQFSLQ